MYTAISAFSGDLTIPHLDLSHLAFASWVTSDIWLVSFNSRTAVMAEFIVENSKKLFF